MEAEEHPSEKISLKDKFKAMALMAKLGIKLSKEQVDMAIDSIGPILQIQRLSHEAKEMVFPKNKLNPNADFDGALAKVAEAKAIAQKWQGAFDLMGHGKVVAKFQQVIDILERQQKEIEVAKKGEIK
ncbi:MAG: hypothetical protein ACP5JY_02745 [Candidatus Nanoarchaeia archaeon]